MNTSLITSDAKPHTFTARLLMIAAYCVVCRFLHFHSSYSSNWKIKYIIFAILYSVLLLQIKNNFDSCMNYYKLLCKVIFSISPCCMLIFTFFFTSIHIVFTFSGECFYGNFEITLITKEHNFSNCRLTIQVGRTRYLITWKIKLPWHFRQKYIQ